jgi:hypothetical protein
MPTTSGPDLRRERRAADVTVVAMRPLMGLSRQAIHSIERAAAPSPERVRQYRDALARAVAERLEEASRHDDGTMTA